MLGCYRPAYIEQIYRVTLAAILMAILPRPTSQSCTRYRSCLKWRWRSCDPSPLLLFVFVFCFNNDNDDDNEEDEED